MFNKTIFLFATTALYSHIVVANVTPTLAPASAYTLQEVNSSAYTSLPDNLKFFDTDVDGTIHYYKIDITTPLSAIIDRKTPANISDNAEITSPFYGISLGNLVTAGTNPTTGGAISNVTYYGVQPKVITSINADFIHNSITKTNTDNIYGGAISNKNDSAKILNIKGDFIGNFLQSDTNITKGGAIHNAALIGDVNLSGAVSSGGIVGNFIKNYVLSVSAVANGGAIWNESSGKIGFIDARFFQNYSSTNSNSYGGAIHNAGVIGMTNSTYLNDGGIRGGFIGNFSKSLTGLAAGGAIYNENTNSKIVSINAYFYNNYSITNSNTAKGGAIYNNGTIGIVDSSNNMLDRGINGEFIGNFAGLSKYSQGGAIFNDITGKIGSISGYFANNNTKSTIASYAGAIYNSGNIGAVDIGSGLFRAGGISGTFNDNYAYAEDGISVGGAIYNNTNATINNVAGEFTTNYSKSKNNNATGGAIHNTGTIGQENTNGIFADFYANFAESEAGFSTNAFAYGGAIYNHKDAKINNIIGNFTQNYAKTSATTSYGGAIYNNGTIGVLDGSNTLISGGISGNFVDNYAKSTGSLYAHGGAIYNNYDGSIYNISGNFSGNYVSATKGSTYGGAIYNDGLIYKILNSSFFNNYAEHKDNTKYAKGGAIYSTTDLLIEADNDVSIFSGNFVTAGTTTHSNAIYMGKAGTNITLNAVHNGQIIFDDELDGNAETYQLILSGDTSGKINFNEKIQNANIIQSGENTTNVLRALLLMNNNSLTLDDGTFNILDMELTKLQLNSLGLNGGVLNINKTNADLENKIMGSLSATAVTGNSTNINIKSINLISDAATDVTSVVFAHNTDFAEQVVNSVSFASAPVFNYVVDYNKTSGEFIFTREKPNSSVLSVSGNNAIVASLTDEIYTRVFADIDDPYGFLSCSRKPGGAFVKTFTSNDNVDLKNLSDRADANFSGIIAGFESQRINEGKGISAIYNAYTAYANGDNKFDYEKFRQNAYYLGVGATFYKEKAFVGATANVAMVNNDGKDAFGSDKFDSYLAGAAFKAGYNYKLAGLIVQPNLYASYTFIKSNDYTTGRGANVDLGDMYSIELAPGLKLATELVDGLQGYITARYVHTFNESQSVKANGFALPEISLKPYIEYGVGVEKRLESISGFAEITRRDGGREGWNGLLGAKYHW